MAKRELRFDKRKDGITVSLLEGGVEKGRLSRLPTREEAAKAALREWGHIPTLQMEAVGPEMKSTQPRLRKPSVPPPEKPKTQSRLKKPSVPPAERVRKPATSRTVPPKKPAKYSKVWPMSPPLNCYCPEQRAQLRTVRKGVEKD